VRARTASAAGLAWVLLSLSLLSGGCAGGNTLATATTAAATSASAASEARSSTTTTTSEAGTSSTSTTEDPGVIRVGALFPLTGDLAAQGQASIESLRLAVEEVNASGGIRALGGASLVLVEADSQGDPEVGAGEVRRLVEEEGVCAVVGAIQSTVALRVTEAAESLQVPFILSSAAADEITERGLKYTFRLAAKADWYARDQVRFLADSVFFGGLVVTKVALLHEDGAFGQATAAGQRKYLEEAGIEVVADLSYPADQADLHNEILQIKAGEAQAVLTATYLSDAILIAQGAQLSRLGLPLLDAAGGVSDPAFIARAGAAAQGMLTELEYSPGASATKLEKAMGAASGRPLTAAGLYAYQAVWLLANALERGGSAETGQLRRALATTAMPAGEHMVLPQSVLTFDGAGQNRGARLFIAQIQDATLVPLWPEEYRKGTFLLP
jgi:branched-chain amino acid transport system substrate-binding protein